MPLAISLHSAGYCVLSLTNPAPCRAVAITIDLKKRDGFGPKLKDFKAALEGEVPKEIQELRSDVEDFAKQFPTIGFDKGQMRYKD